MNKKAKSILKPFFYFGFIEALIFWYAIEKLLWDSSGLTAEQIVFLGIIAQSSQVLIEVPSSIIADRWSRRKTLIASSAFMLAAIIIVIAVQSFMSFLVMSLLWAFYFAFQSGTVNAYIYDLLKEQNEESQYRKAISRYATYQLSGLLVSSLGASVLIKFGGYLTPYWVSLIPTIVAIIILFKMKDPPIERTEESSGNALDHVKNSIRNVAAKRWLRLIFLGLAFVTAGRFIWYEYYQLFALDREVAAVLFGVMLALIHVGNILGSEFAHKIKSPNRVLLTAFSAMAISSLLLIFTSNQFVIIFFLILCFFGSQASSIVLDESLQHQTKSELRATTLSLVGLLSRVFFGAGALSIIIFDSTASAIAATTATLFVGTLAYYPVRKRLVPAE